MTDISNHTIMCSCEDCHDARETFDYMSGNPDMDLALIARLLDTIDASSCVVVGYRGNTWTITDSRG
jgi:hypothetical protein